MSSKKVSVIGIGRLGLCLALVLERAGYDVLGMDIFPSYVEALNNKTFKSDEPRVVEFLTSSKNFKATSSIDDAINFSDVLMILVDTPSTGGDRFYDHSKLNNVLSTINSKKVSNKHMVICCTVIPGYIHTVGRYLIKDCKNSTLSYNPEFIAQGDIVRGLLRPDMVLIGEGSKEAGAWLEQAYKDMTENEPSIRRMKPESAEITKLAVNCFITMKISYCNQVADIADATPGADKFEILSAVGEDSRVGPKCLKPGYGFGGPCFPRDNRALGHYAKKVGVDPKVMIATDEYNVYHTDRMAEALLKENKSVYVFEDVAYKPLCPVPIIEESQPLAVAERLVKKGKKVIIKDRKKIVDAVIKEFGYTFEYEYTDA
jgi:nucleotide sugar dehydrogenase